MPFNSPHPELTPESHTSPSAGSAETLSAALHQNPRYRIHRAFHSSFLPTDRDLYVYLPRAYDIEPERRFPVLYLHDGQNLFDGCLSYVQGQTWQANTTADALTAAGEIEPLILVGIANAGTHRIAEYTPYPNLDPRMTGGLGPLYGRLLVEELLPFIHAEYRTLTSPVHTGIAGSSLGGLISLWLGLEYPHIFGNLGVLSPSLWWNNGSILTNIENASLPPGLRIWLDIGTLEGAPHVRNTQRLDTILERKGMQHHRNLAFQIAEAAGHTESAWAARFPEVLRFLFPASP